MVYLLLAVASSSAISLMLRFSKGKTSGEISVLVINYLVCVIIAVSSVGVGNIFPAVNTLKPALIMGIICGFLYLASFLLYQFNIQRNGVVLSSVFMRLGLLVPLVVSVFLFNEVPTAVQIAGASVAVVAIVMINLGGERSASKLKMTLPLLLVASGSADTMSKVFERFGDIALSGQFLCYTFSVSLIFCAALMLYKKEHIGLNDLIFGALVGVPNYYSAKFLLKALEYMPAVIVYPTHSVATIAVVSLGGVLIFKEHLDKRQWYAVGAILAALVLLNI